ncbi:hypothetical protein QJS04_geneDACA020873 [Acorus gramineus]|uniref:Uncharacterized protein n=1 Tax=Acorus gramineus TaxID=55184 RepID=A0AAV9BQU2_ACOGR|nr:hypothetical protein QJS04_geneDACA020873 [Acorus gramineus]
MRRDVSDVVVGDAIFSLATLETTIFIVDKGNGDTQLNPSTDGHIGGDMLILWIRKVKLVSEMQIKADILEREADA